MQDAHLVGTNLRLWFPNSSFQVQTNHTQIWVQPKTESSPDTVRVDLTQFLLDLGVNSLPQRRMRQLSRTQTNPFYTENQMRKGLLKTRERHRPVKRHFCGSAIKLSGYLGESPVLREGEQNNCFCGQILPAEFGMKTQS